MKVNEHLNGIKQRSVKMKSVITIQEFYSRLQSMDWFFPMSDSRAAYEVGAKKLEKLETTASYSSEFQSLLDSYRAYVFSGEEWGTQQLELPSKPDIDAAVEMLVPVVSHAGAYLMHQSTENTNEIWDKTRNIDGHFILREISGGEKLLGVFKTYGDVNNAASIAVNATLGGFGDVVIENIKLFESVDSYVFN